MTMNIYVGNLSYQTNSETLQKLFEGHGAVTSARVVSDHVTGQPRGFGFVEMGSRDEAAKAIEALNGTELDQRKIVVNEARPRTERSGGGGGGGGGPRRGSGGGGGGGMGGGRRNF